MHSLSIVGEGCERYLQLVGCLWARPLQATPAVRSVRDRRQNGGWTAGAGCSF
jgi:hypothetical protein